MLGEAAVGVNGGRADASAHPQVAQVAIGHAEDVDVLGRITGERERGAGLGRLQSRRWVQIAFEASRIVVDDVAVVGHEAPGAFLHMPDAGDDGEAQVSHVLAGCIVDDGVDVALPLQFERRQTHFLGTLLPRQVESPGNAGEAARLNRAEDAIAHRQDHVAGG